MASPLDINNLFSVKGLVAVVTGGGTGIGLMIARGLDANGAAAVYIIGRREETLKKAAEKAINGKIFPLVGDVTSQSSLTSIASHVREKHGYVDVVFANAGGVSTNGDARLPKDREVTAKEFADAHLEDSMEEFTKTFNINISSVFYTSMAFLDLLDQGNKRAAPGRPKSSVVVTSSAAGFARVFFVGMGYNSSKAGVQHLVKLLATRLAEFKIRVNAIAPGVFPSELSADMPFLKGDPSKEGSVSKNIIPLERAGTEEDMAGLAIFLTSPAGGFVTGQIIANDGGRLGMVPSSY